MSIGSVTIHDTRFAVSKTCDANALKRRIVEYENRGYISMESVGFRDNAHTRVFVWKLDGDARELRGAFNVDSTYVDATIEDAERSANGGMVAPTKFVALDDVAEYARRINS